MTAAPAVPIVRSDVTFTSGGERCAGWWYEPAAEPDGRAIVMANGFSLTRHDGLPAYAERFAAAGFAVLLFDHRNLGFTPTELKALATKAGLEVLQSGVATREKRPPHFEVLTMLARKP